MKHSVAPFGEPKSPPNREQALLLRAISRIGSKSRRADPFQSGDPQEPALLPLRKVGRCGFDFVDGWVPA